MSNVANALAHKVKPMISIAPQASVLEALRLMADNNVGSVVAKTYVQMKSILDGIAEA